MAFHPSRSLRAAGAALVLIALTTFALLAFAAVASAATPACKGKTIAWKVNGKTVCLKTAKPAAGHDAATMKSRFAFWLRSVNSPLVRKKIKVPASFGKAQPTVIKAVGRAFGKTASLGTKSRHAKILGIADAGRGAVVDSMSVESGRVTAENGTVVSATMDAREFADGSQDFKLTISAKKDGDEVRLEPLMVGSKTVLPDVQCPTHDGKLSIVYDDIDGGTMKVFRKGKLVGAATEKLSHRLRAEGHVGRDARLHDVDATSTIKTEQYTRGVQLVVTSSGTFSIPRDGNPVMQGTPSVDVKLKVAGATRSQEREAERGAAANLAASPDAQSALANYAELARWRMKLDEYKWYTIPNGCAHINYTPDSTATLAAGQTTTVKAVIRSHDGGEGSGDVVVQSVERGTFAAVKSEADPGSPALFTAKGAAPDADKTTVGSESIATSTAGRAQWGWYAKDNLQLPPKISGTVAVWTDVSGQSPTYFHSWVVYTLANVYVSDNGYISAFYDLTTADQDTVENTLGSATGCRYFAHGSGGTINSGDLELRKAPGEPWKHAIQYDVSIPDGTFEAVDCGPSPPPSFTGDIVGFLNMAMLGGEGFYGVGDGFHMQETALTYTDPVSGRKTTADWILDPGDPK